MGERGSFDEWNMTRLLAIGYLVGLDSDGAEKASEAAGNVSEAVMGSVMVSDLPTLQSVLVNGEKLNYFKREAGQ